MGTYTDLSAAVEAFDVADGELRAMSENGVLIPLQDYRSLVSRHAQASKSLEDLKFNGVKQHIHALRTYCEQYLRVGWGPRDEVQEFAMSMERELHLNDHKGKAGWRNCSNLSLVHRLREEVEELAVALQSGAPITEIVSEAADVGNFAMMIADNARRTATADLGSNG